MSEIYDVIVLGGGIVGASTAYALRNQGQNVLLIEQFEPGHKNGSSHGDGRVVRFNYTEAIYVEMAMLAYKSWDRLNQASGETLIRETGMLEYGPQGTEAIDVTIDILKTYDIPHEKLSPDDARQGFPQYAFADDTDIVFQPGGAVAMATPALKALWRLFRDNGGVTQTNTRIETINAQADLVTLTSTEGETFRAKNLVMTAGGWTKQFAAQMGLDLPLDVTQEILAYFPPKDDSVNHQVGTMPVMIDHHPVLDTDAHFYSLPIVDIQGVKIGWHHSGIPMAADDERVISDEIVSAIQGWVDVLYPNLEREPIDLHTCLYTNTPDYHFILDKHPEFSNVIVGAGFSGHGFKFGPILGELLAGLVLGQDAPIDMSMFAISRFENEETLSKRLGA